MQEGDFAEQAARLLAVLGYRSERTLPDQSGSVDDFLKKFSALPPGAKSELEFRKAASSIYVLFQITDEEIEEAGGNRRLFRDNEFDTGNVKSFLFTVVELRGDTYAKGRYAAFTREINKCFPTIPAVVLFRTASGRVTLSFVHVRPNKRNPERNVIGSVSLIREIISRQPHRAHLDILAELSLEWRLRWMDAHRKERNFDGLLGAWLDALDTEELNRRFYRDLFGWFNRAVKEASFSTGGAKSLQPEEHVIRLITRLLFVWFVKEKGLVVEGLFVEPQVAPLLKGYDPATGDSYYRAVLQNLFFATLNTEISRRGFSSQANVTHRDFSRYRYASEIADADALLDLFAKTPFINGGLFDCLDSEEATGGGGWRIDCFTDNPAQRRGYSIPNRLFFDDAGLISLFNHYKFTVEENTPAEQEVALDPELLGKVFENLLAAYNPETRESARKQTGSYYTPRAVVDYMVDEALTAALAQKAQPADGDAAFWEERLRYLLDYNDAGELFSETETEQLVRAIAGIRVLDPAVGSGAFPMGVLHKLTLALRRLDPDNRRWEALQKELAGNRAASAFDTQNQKERDAELQEISGTFERYRDSDFGRKLYLVQNSIYGVDIQPVACQIAKLRFFISLAIEQHPTGDRDDNYGIHPLPNLETRFAAANALLGLDAATQIPLGGQNRVSELNDQLRQNRERHFHAGTRHKKLSLRQEDARLRVALAEELGKAGMSASDAGKVSRWDPYDQNAHANWFDPEYMFGVTDRFDVVIGNPPYVESRNSLLSDQLKDSYSDQVMADWGQTLPRGSDLLMYFFPRAAKLLHDTGVGCFITQNAWLSTDYGQEFQRFSLGRFSFRRIVDTRAKFFPDTNSQNINAVITVFSKILADNIEYSIADGDMTVTPSRAISAKHTMKWGHLFAMPQFFAETLSQLSAVSSKGSFVSFGQGLNFPLKNLDQCGASIPVIVRGARFVAHFADGAITEVSASRKSKIPALIMPRGIGKRYYCTFNHCRAFSYSHVELYLPDHLWESDDHYCLWAYMNSSFVWLFREATGRRNLGGGLLKAEATDMKALPIGFKFDFANDARSVFDIIRNREPLPVSQEVYTKEHLLIDDMVADCLGFRNVQDSIRQTLVEQIDFRIARSRPKGQLPS